MKTVIFHTFKSSDARRLVVKTAGVLASREIIVLGGDSKMVASRHARHHGLVRANACSFSTLASDEEIRSAAEAAIKSDGHVYRRMLRGDAILGRVEVFTGTSKFHLTAEGKLQ